MRRFSPKRHMTRGRTLEAVELVRAGRSPEEAIRRVLGDHPGYGQWRTFLAELRRRRMTAYGGPYRGRRVSLSSKSE